MKSAATTAGVGATAAPASTSTTLHARWPPRRFWWFERPVPDLEIQFTDPESIARQLTGANGTGVASRTPSVVGSVRLPALAPLTRQKGSMWMPISNPDDAREVRGYALVSYEHNFDWRAQADEEASAPDEIQRTPPPALLLVEVAAVSIRHADRRSHRGESSSPNHNDSVLIGYGAHSATVPLPAKGLPAEGSEADCRGASVLAFPVHSASSEGLAEKESNSGGSEEMMLRFQLRSDTLAVPIHATRAGEAADIAPPFAATALLALQDAFTQPATALESGFQDDAASLAKPELREWWLPLSAQHGLDAASTAVTAAGELLVRWSLWPALPHSVVPECVAAFDVWHGGPARLSVTCDGDEGSDCDDLLECELAVTEEAHHFGDDDEGSENGKLREAWRTFVGAEVKRQWAKEDAVDCVAATDCAESRAFLVLSRLAWDVPEKSKAQLLQAANISSVWIEVTSAALTTTADTTLTAAAMRRVSDGTGDTFVDQTGLRESGEAMTWGVDEELIFPLSERTVPGGLCAATPGEKLTVRVLGLPAGSAESAPRCLATGSMNIERHHRDFDHHCHLHDSSNTREAACNDFSCCEAQALPQWWSTPLTVPHTTGAALDGAAEGVGRLTWLMEKQLHPFGVTAIAPTAAPNTATPSTREAHTADESGGSDTPLLVHLSLTGLLLHHVDYSALPSAAPTASVDAEVVCPAVPFGGGHRQETTTATVGRQHARPNLSRSFAQGSLERALHTVSLTLREGGQGTSSRKQWSGDVCLCNRTTVALYFTAPSLVTRQHQQRAAIPRAIAAANPNDSAITASFLPTTYSNSSTSTIHGKATIVVSDEAFHRSDGGVFEEKLTVTDAATGSWLGEAVLRVSLLASLPIEGRALLSSSSPAALPPSHLFFTRTVQVSAWRCVGPVRGDIAKLQECWETCQALRVDAAAAKARGEPLGKAQRKKLAEAARVLSVFLKESALSGKNSEAENEAPVALQLSMTVNGGTTTTSRPFYVLHASTFASKMLDGNTHRGYHAGSRPLAHLATPLAVVDPMAEKEEETVTVRLQLRAFLPPAETQHAQGGEEEAARTPVNLGEGQWCLPLPSAANARSARLDVGCSTWLPIRPLRDDGGASARASVSPIASVFVQTIAEEVVSRGEFTLTCVRVVPSPGRLPYAGNELSLRFPSLRFTHAFTDGTRHTQYMPLFASGTSSWAWPLSGVRMPRVGLFGGRIVSVDLMDFTNLPYARRDPLDTAHGVGEGGDSGDGETAAAAVNRSTVGVIVATHRWSAVDEAALFLSRPVERSCVNGSAEAPACRTSAEPQMHWLSFPDGSRVLLSVARSKGELSMPVHRTARDTTTDTAPLAVRRILLRLKDMPKAAFAGKTAPTLACSLAAACCSEAQAVQPASAETSSPWREVEHNRQATSYSLVSHRDKEGGTLTDESDQHAQSATRSLSACWELPSNGTCMAFAVAALRDGGSSAPRLRLVFTVGETTLRATCLVRDLVELSRSDGVVCTSTLAVTDNADTTAVAGEVQVSWLLTPALASMGGALSLVPPYSEKPTDPAALRTINGRAEADVLRDLTNKLNPCRAEAVGDCAKNVHRCLARLAEDARRLQQTQAWVDVLLRAQRAQEKAPRRLARRHWAWSVVAVEVEGVRLASAAPPGPSRAVAGGVISNIGESPAASAPLLAQLSFPAENRLRKQKDATDIGADKEAEKAMGLAVGVARAEAAAHHGAPSKREGEEGANADCCAHFQPIAWQIFFRDLAKTATRRGAALSIWQLLKCGGGNGERAEEAAQDNTEAEPVRLLGRVNLREVFSDLRDVTEAALADLEAAVEDGDATVLPAPILRTDWLAMRSAGDSEQSGEKHAAVSSPMPRARLLLRAPWAGGAQPKAPVASKLTAKSITSPQLPMEASATLSALITSVVARPPFSRATPLANLALIATVLPQAAHEKGSVADDSTQAREPCFYTKLIPLVNGELTPPKVTTEEGAERQPEAAMLLPSGLPVPVPVPVPVPMPAAPDNDAAQVIHKSHSGEGDDSNSATDSKNRINDKPSSSAEEAQALVPTTPLFLWSQRTTSSTAPPSFTVAASDAAVARVHLRFYIVECAPGLPSPELLLPLDDPIPPGALRRLLGSAECFANLPVASQCDHSNNSRTSARVCDVTAHVPFSAHDGDKERPMTLEVQVRLCSGPSEAQTAVMAAAESTAARVAASRRHTHRQQGSRTEAELAKAAPAGHGWWKRKGLLEPCTGDCQSPAASSPFPHPQGTVHLQAALGTMRVLTIPWPPPQPLQLAVASVGTGGGDCASPIISVDTAEAQCVLLGGATIFPQSGDYCLTEGGIALRMSRRKPSSSMETENASKAARGRQPRTKQHPSRRPRSLLERPRCTNPATHQQLQRTTASAASASSSFSARLQPHLGVSTTWRVDMEKAMPHEVRAEEEDSAPCYVGHVAATTATLGESDARTWFLGGIGATDAVWSSAVRCARLASGGPATAVSFPKQHAEGAAQKGKRRYPWVATATVAPPHVACSAAMVHRDLIFLFGGLVEAASPSTASAVPSNDLLAFDTTHLAWYGHQRRKPLAGAFHCSTSGEAAAATEDAQPSLKTGSGDVCDSSCDTPHSSEADGAGGGSGTTAWPGPRFGHSVVQIPSSDTARGGSSERASSSSSFYVMCGGAISATQLVPAHDMLWVCELNSYYGCRWQRVPLPSASRILRAALTPRFQPRLGFTWVDPEDGRNFTANRSSCVGEGGSAPNAAIEGAWAAAGITICGGAKPQQPISLAAVCFERGLSPQIANFPAFAWWLAGLREGDDDDSVVHASCVCPRATSV